MKPRYNWIKKSLPVMITVALAAPFAANAAIFTDDSAGNATPPPGTAASTTIIADGPDPMVPAGNLVTIGSSINLNGQNDQLGVLVTSGASPYTVTIASGGVLSADSDQDAINSSSALTLTNYGVIDTLGTSQGIETVGGSSIINNYNLIYGSNDAIRFTTNGGTVNNYAGASIIGDNGAASDGIEGTGAFTVNNYGSISGNDDGVFSAGSASVYNNYGGSITGLNDGIDTDGSLYLENDSSISGTNSNGVETGNGSNLNNYGGATITGGLSGVSAGSGLTLSNSGTITGGTGDGVNAAGGGNTTITNYGTISTSDGSMSPAGLDGVQITNSAVGDVVNNFGSIMGTVNGVEFFAGGGAILNNSGIITGGTRSFYGSSGIDTVNLNFGSQMIGDLDGTGGVDTINFSGGLASAGDSPSGSSSNSILGDVTEFETINKSGSGVAFIGVPGNGGYEVVVDTINITGGGLYLNADVSADDGEGGIDPTTINAGGTALGGTGTWNANIAITAGGISAGAIPINLTNSPTEAVGTLNLVGNVTHSSGTWIRHDVIPNGTDDLINHSGGTYALGANTDIRVSATDNDTVIRNGLYTVIDSNSVITGGSPDMSVQFNQNVNNNDSGYIGSLTGNTGVGNTSAVINRFMESDFTDGDSNLVFYVDHNFEGLPGLTASESALGAALDDSISNPNAQIQDFIAALDYSDLGTVQETLASLVPDHVLGAASGLVGANYRLHRVVEDHLAMTRNGGTIVETPASTDAKGGMIPAQVTSTGSGAGNIWGTVSYDWRDSDFGTTDIDGEDASFTVGADYRVAPNLLIGILADGTQSSYDYTGGDSDTDSYRFAAYGTYGESTGLYADFLVAYGNHDLDSSRKLGGILADYSSNSSTDADSLQAMLTVGYTMDSGCVKHGPFAGLEYQNIDVDGFTTSGTGAFGSVGDFDIDSLRLLVGYRAQASFGSFTPFGSVAYAHEFEDGPISATATIPGGASYRFSGGGADSAILVTLGTAYSFTESLSATLAYHGEFTTGDGAESQGASLGLNYEF